MAKQKSEVFSISLKQKHKDMALSQSESVLGKENISGYFAYLLEREHKNLSKWHQKKERTETNF